MHLVRQAPLPALKEWPRIGDKSYPSTLPQLMVVRHNFVIVQAAYLIFSASH